MNSERAVEQFSLLNSFYLTIDRMVYRMIYVEVTNIVSKRRKYQ
jgi:hypothetical protein